MQHISRVLTAGTLALALLAAGPAIAQTQNGGAAQPGQAPAPTQQAQDFSQSDLQKFARANTSIRDIRESAINEIQQADGEDAQTQIREQAQQQMLAAIKDADMTLDEYNTIGRAAQSNPELAKRIQQMQ